MFNVLGLYTMADSGQGPCGIFGTASPAAVMAGVGLCLAAPVLACCYNGPPRGVGGRRHRRGMPRFLLFPLVICVIVLASRGFRSTFKIDPRDAEDDFNVSATAVERADSSLEHRVERFGDQFGRRVDRRADQFGRSVDRSASQLERHIERLVARIESHFNHLAQQTPHKQVKPAIPVAVVQMRDEPEVTEPNAPALPISGTIPAEAGETPVATAPSAPASAPNPPPAVSAPAVASVPQTTAAASPAPSSPVAAPVAAAAPSAPTAGKTSAVTESESEKLPEWTKTELVNEEHRELVVVTGGFGGSQKEAEQNALEASRHVLGAAISRAYPKVGRWLPSADAVRADAVRLSFTEKVHRKTQSTGTPFIVYRAYEQVELSPAVYALLIANWKEEVVPWRLELLASCVALLTLTFGTGAAYFRLNERTRGQYRGRLGLAAVTVIAVGGAFAAAAVFG